MELNKNNLYLIQLKGRKDVLSGILISFGLEWVLLKYNPVDYVLDGYLLIRRKFIRDIIRGENEIFNESVIHQKWTVAKFDKTHPKLDEITDVLYFLLQYETVIQFDFYDDSICYIGEIKKLYFKTIRIRGLDPKGNWEDESSFQIERIRTIQFDNDYINSLVAYNKWLNR
jgi:hypothetical protein